MDSKGKPRKSKSTRKPCKGNNSQCWAENPKTKLPKTVRRRQRQIKRKYK